MAFETKDNEAFCFSKEGFTGFSGIIKITEPGEYWVTVYDNQGKKGDYRAVKLKPKQSKSDKPSPQPSFENHDDQDMDTPF